MKVKCRYDNCQHEWEYKGISFKAQCYKCKRYTPVKQEIKEGDMNAKKQECVSTDLEIGTERIGEDKTL